MSHNTPSIRVNVDPTNPGQYFACCGLLELADRMWGHALGAFDGNEFMILGSDDLPAFIQQIATVELKQLDPENPRASSILVELKERPLHLDWWKDELAGGFNLKVWAGKMEAIKIANAMQYQLQDDRFQSSDILNIGSVAYDIIDRSKKVEPFNFDARRAANSHARDIGFSTDKLEMTTLAYPAVEFLSLIGIQRCQPIPAKRSNWFIYHTWERLLPPCLAAGACSGVLPIHESKAFRFENWPRNDYYSCFRSAVPTLAEVTDE